MCKLHKMRGNRIKYFSVVYVMTNTNGNDFHKTGKEPDGPITAISKTYVFRISFNA